MYILNCSITDDAEKILKSYAKKYGCGMGTVVTMWALKNEKEDAVLSLPFADMLAELAKAGQATD